MEFPRIENAIQTCATHLDATGTRNTEIEGVLVGYLLTITYAEYEGAVRKIVAARGDLHNDERLSAFMTYAAERLIRSIAIGEIGGLLKRFDVVCHQAFQSKIANTPSHTAFDNLLSNRQDVAHRLGANITLAEFQRFYQDSLPVFDAIEEALQ